MVTSTDATKLTVAESAKLENLEDVIQGGLKSFVEVGRALQQIRDGKLYRQSHETFETYCQDRWGMTRQYANQLVRSAETVTRIELETVVSKPSTERQARPLGKLPEAERAQAWQEAVEEAAGDEPTAQEVEEVVDRRKWICPHCGHVQWSDEEDCEKCREPREAPKGKPRAEQAEQPEFDREKERDKLTDTVRKLAKRWPDEYRNEFCQWLTNLAKELKR